MKTKLVGQTMNPYSASEVQKGMQVELSHEKDNKYSKVAIVAKKGSLVLGHIGEKNNPNHQILFQQLPITAEVSNFSVVSDNNRLNNAKPGDVATIELEMQVEGERNADGQYLIDGKMYTSATTVLDTNFTGIVKYAISKATGAPMKFNCPYFYKYEKALEKDAMEGTLMHDLLEVIFTTKGTDKFEEQYRIWRDGYISHGVHYKGSDLSDEQVNHIFSLAKNLDKKYNISVIDTEGQVKDDDIMVAGRYDFFAEIDGKKVVIDWKSSNKVQEKHLVQGSFYSKCLNADEFWVVLVYLQKINKAPKQGYSIKKIDTKQIDSGYQKMKLMKQYKDIKV